MPLCSSNLPGTQRTLSSRFLSLLQIVMLPGFFCAISATDAGLALRGSHLATVLTDIQDLERFPIILGHTLLR